LKSKAKKGKEAIEQYTHGGKKRSNNPPVGLVTPQTDPDLPRKKYSHDPRLDPQLQWSGKLENQEFGVDTVSLHVHERVDPGTILEKTMRPKQHEQQTMLNFFDAMENNPPLRDAIDFYRHDQNWSNRLIAGDSLLVMNSLLEKEGMEGKVQMIYMDPPYGIKYGSNFQPFVNQRDVKDGKDEDLTQEPEMIKAFRDTWELGIHSYLTYIYDRILLSKKLLNETGSIFIQIGEKNNHHVKEILDEIFGVDNFCSMIVFRKTGSESTKLLSTTCDYLLWYAKDKKKVKYHNLYFEKKIGEEGAKEFTNVELPDGTIRKITTEEIVNPNLLPKHSKVFATWPIISAGFSENNSQPIELEYEGEKFTLKCGNNKHWSVGKEGIENLWNRGRLLRKEGLRIYKKYLSDFPYSTINSLWLDTRGETNMKYVVQTSTSVIMRCIMMTTDPSDLVFDPTCGSGTTAYSSEYLGRRWMTCDTSRISIFLTRQRLMTSFFPFFKLFREEEGISSGFEYKKIENKVISSVAHDLKAEMVTLYDQPKTVHNKIRISGPFTVESVPSPVAKSIDVLSEENSKPDETNTINKISHQQQWRDELFKTGIRGKQGQKIEFTRVESHPATKWIHADAETKENPKRAVISFGPEHAPLEQRQVANTIDEAQTLVPKPDMIIFASMQFDPEAAKDIDELNWPGVTILKVEMNKDLLTDDLKKKRSSNESFWLMGQPDVELQKTKDEKYIVKVNGFDYYNSRTGEVESGGSSRISMWMLDADYDGRSVYPSQVFFPMDGKAGGWSRLAKTLRAQLDEDLISKYHGTESIPFEGGFNKRAAVKIIDDRGIESLKIIDLE